MTGDVTRSARRRRWPRYVALLGAAIAGLLMLATLTGREAQWVLEGAGYDPGRDGSPTQFFAARARVGLTRAEVARAMPRPARVEYFLDETAPGLDATRDSTLLELYVYEDARGRVSWPVYIYYGRDGRVEDVYAQDAPGTGGARRVTEREAEEWLRRTP